MEFSIYSANKQDFIKIRPIEWQYPVEQHKSKDKWIICDLDVKCGLFSAKLEHDPFLKYQELVLLSDEIKNLSSGNKNSFLLETQERMIDNIGIQKLTMIAMKYHVKL
ncbi:hypothetical protein JW887_06400 [Candidatus Dojkabacteria bacterium]|nr:hypothetical protein [Candidatus Dojkabacteria bacterium]